jgi:hypothetical protein
LGALASPATASKESEDDESQVGVMPVPLSDTVVVGMGAVVVMVSVAGCEPVVVGLKVSPTVQLLPAANVAPHVDVPAMA